MANYTLLYKGIIAGICLLEGLGFCYAPILLRKHLKKLSNKYINSKTLDSATSGAILSLSLTHLMPEGFSTSCSQLAYKHLDFTGYIALAPIVFLISIDFLIGDPSIDELENPALGSDEKGTLSSEKLKLHKSKARDIEDGNVQNEKSWIKKIIAVLKTPSFYLLITLVYHSVLEGMLVGSKNCSALWAMAFGIVAHKWAECLIMINILENASYCVKHVSILLFCFAVPTGIFLGHFVAIKNVVWEIVLGQLAAGFFIYLSFELLLKNNEYNKKNKFTTWASYMIGIIVMSFFIGLATYYEKMA